uniref:AAA family ATPase n=1 Tax=Kitasatospora sp. SC0581 TaxID=3394360 RepID=UPI003A83F47F
MTTPHANTPPSQLPPGPGRTTAGPVPEDGGVELFPVNFTAYRNHVELDTEQHVRAIADLLAPYGLHVNHWAAPEKERDRQAVEDRLGDWKRLTASHRGNTVLYWVGHGSAEHLAHHRTPAPIDDGVHPEDVARAIGRRRLHPDAEDSWAVVVLDACFSKDFARKVHGTLISEYGDADRFLLLSTAAEGHAELGDFTRALEHALTITFLGQKTIGLAELGSQLARELRGYRAINVDDHRDRLVRTLPDVASAVSAPLDQIAELQAVIDRLPADEQRHFLPKASGAELGELAWYFHGRTEERDTILRWLTTTASGSLVVTGPAGSGKSALLGHILHHTNPQLRDVLIRHGHLTPLPSEVPCPDDPFDLTVHLSGLTLTHTVQLVAQAAGLPDLARQAADGQPPSDLVARLLGRLRDRQAPLTLLFDALDEAEQPLVLADTLLRHLADLPRVRIVIGTRSSTKEGPDQPAPDDTDILDALRPRSHSHGTGLEYVEVTQNQDALAGYLRAKLHAARQQRTLDADEATIEAAVRRLVTDQQQDGTEPQQFLYVRLAAHELLNNPTLLADPTALTGRTHRQLFTQALQRLHHTNPHYTPLLRSLGLAQGRGLPDQDGIWARTADALTPEGAGHTGAGIPGLVRDAAPYLALDQEHGQSVYRLAHRTFTEHFTTTPDSPAAHAAITTALARQARHSLATRTSSGGAVRPGDVSPYIRHHLITHARLGHTAGALQTLADHPDVLDTLDLAGITAATLYRGLPPNEVPPAIAGTVLFQNHIHETGADQYDHDMIGWRRWWRRLGTAYIQGTPPPAETHAHSPATWPPRLVGGAVRRRQLHLQLVGHDGAVGAVAVFAAPDGTPRLVTGGNDGTVRIWNPATGTQDGEFLTGYGYGGVGAVAVFAAPDGTPRLATGGYDRAVRIWNPATGTQDGEFLTGHDGAVGA